MIRISRQRPLKLCRYISVGIVSVLTIILMTTLGVLIPRAKSQVNTFENQLTTSTSVTFDDRHTAMGTELTTTSFDFTEESIDYSYESFTVSTFRSTETSTSTTSTTSSTTSTILVLTSSLWKFDNDTRDSLSHFHGVSMNGPTYRTPGFDGTGAALQFIRNNQQYVSVSQLPNVFSTNLTIELWLYSIDLTNDTFGLLGQRDVHQNTMNWFVQLRIRFLYVGFMSMNISSSTIIQTNRWYHVALSYDFANRSLKLFLNGLLENTMRTDVVLGTSGIMTIGRTDEIIDNPSYFNGVIDQISIVTRTKSPEELADDSTEIFGPSKLITYHSFDDPMWIDQGPLNLTVITRNINSTIGRVNQAILFLSDSSFYQLRGFSALRINNYAFSISLWTNPSLINGATLIHLSTNADGGGLCVDLLGFSTRGEIVVTSGGILPYSVIGPVLTVNTWSHVVATYSLTNGIRLYVNGTLVGTTGSMSYLPWANNYYLTLGNSLDAWISFIGFSLCLTHSIGGRSYRGSIDEFRIYARELDLNEIWLLSTNR